ncbi:hypothetical protein, partial [Achromobacter sp. LC458]|uniref:hypothetical protein n=1 Tax=Achromobacter sp. LC458 TaxID=1120623 RepID=UPI001C8F2963
MNQIGLAKAIGVESDMLAPRRRSEFSERRFFVLLSACYRLAIGGPLAGYWRAIFYIWRRRRAGQGWALGWAAYLKKKKEEETGG